MTSFVGRSRELSELEALAGGARLITITGPGGSGKTRLAFEFAARRRASWQFLWLVDLSLVTDPALVLASIATAIGIREVPGEPFHDTLEKRIGEHDVMLVLDNLEQLPTAGPVIGEALARSPGLRVLATSRAPLHVRGEHEFPLAPLQLPRDATLDPPEELAEVDAVRLFLDRAQAIHPGFALDAENAAAVAGICARLDGLPLAIELAAARTRLFAPTALLARLERRLPVLTGGPADAPERQRTMRAAIDWSYLLLSEGDRRLLMSLSVFIGGCRWEASEMVAIKPAHAGDSDDVPADLERLVDQNVLTVAAADDGEPRFRMLETIREFAWEHVPEPERIALRDRHLAYFVDLAERSEPHLRGPEQARWIRRLAEEQADIRSALAWAYEAHHDESLLRLAAALRRRFWYEAGGVSEGSRWLELALRVDSDAPAGLRAKASHRAAWIAWELGNDERGAELFEASLAAAPADDHLSRFEALIGLSYRALSTGGPDLEVAADRMGEAIEHARHAGTPGALVEPLIAQGLLAKARGEMDGASRLFDEALAMAREADDAWGVANALLQLGALAITTDDPSRAEPLLAESIRMSIDSGDREVFANATASLAMALTAQGDLEPARVRLREGGEAVRDIENPFGDMLVLEAAAGWLGAVAMLPDAVQAWASAETYRAAHGWPAPPAALKAHRRSWATIREALGTVRFEMLWNEGGTRGLREGVEAALVAVDATDLQDIPAERRPAPKGRFDLTPREQEVLALVASGMSDGEIAEQLVISKKTASVHVANIKAKLGASSRVEVATIAMREIVE